MKDSRFLRDICQNADFSCSLSMLFTPVVICNVCIIALSYIWIVSNSLKFSEKGVILLQVSATLHRRAGRSTAVRVSSSIKTTRVLYSVSFSKEPLFLLSLFVLQHLASRTNVTNLATLCKNLIHVKYWCRNFNVNLSATNVVAGC